jgi:hypothetical protein
LLTFGALESMPEEMPSPTAVPIDEPRENAGIVAF